jgi:hypothetical protein
LISRICEKGWIGSFIWQIKRGTRRFPWQHDLTAKMSCVIIRSGLLLLLAFLFLLNNKTAPVMAAFGAGPVHLGRFSAVGAYGGARAFQ